VTGFVSHHNRKTLKGRKKGDKGGKKKLEKLEQGKKTQNKRKS
jgi:hypothetical protein